MTEVVSSPAVVAESNEVDSLARELSKAYQRLVRFYQRELKLSLEAADGRARACDDDDRRRILERPADQMTWFDLSRLAERDQAQALAAWERIRSEARDDLESGHRAALAFRWSDDPWQRARFLAIRAGFLEEWRPVGGVERALIDTLAQTYTMFEYWLQFNHQQIQNEAKHEEFYIKEKGGWLPPRVTTAEAIAESATMADRYHKMFLRTLRALRDLRRYSPPVIVQNAGQVNVGAQQVNVSQPAQLSGADDVR